MKDLFVLVADIDIEITIRTLLQVRRNSLAIRDLSFEVKRHPERDPGIFNYGLEFIRNYQNDYQKFILIFDYEGCGSTNSPRQIQENLREEAVRYGFNPGQVEVIIIQPEFESWVWKSRHHLAKLLEWSEADMNLWLKRNFGLEKEEKPQHPKEVYEQLLRYKKKHDSSKNFEMITKRTGLKNCQDLAFQLLAETLRKWFPKANN